MAEMVWVGDTGAGVGRIVEGRFENEVRRCAQNGQSCTKSRIRPFVSKGRSEENEMPRLAARDDKNTRNDKNSGWQNSARDGKTLDETILGMTKMVGMTTI